MKRSLPLATLVVVMISFVGCCSPGVTEEESPAITVTLNDAAGATVSEDGSTTGANPTSFTVSISSSSGDVTVNTCHVAISCTRGDETLTPETTLTENSEADTCLLTLTEDDLWTYALLPCSVTVEAEAAVGGTDLTEEKTYTFTNKAAVSDDFALDSQAGWPLTQIFSGASWTWDSLVEDEVLTFNAAQGTLDFSGPTDGIEVVMYKEITIEGDWEIMMKLSTSGIDAANLYGEEISLGLNSSLELNEIKRLMITISGGFGGENPTKITASYNSTPGQGPGAVVTTDCDSDGTTYWLKLSANNDEGVVAEFSTDGVNFLPVNQVYEDRDEPFPSADQIREEMRYLTLSFNGIDDTMSASIDEIIVLSGISEF